MSKHFPQTWPDGRAQPVRVGTPLSDPLWRFHVTDDGQVAIGRFSDEVGTVCEAELLLTDEDNAAIGGKVSEVRFALRAAAAPPAPVAPSPTDPTSPPPPLDQGTGDAQGPAGS